MFCTNDVSVAEKICDPNIKVHNLLLSQETDGLEDFKKSLADLFSGGHPLPNNRALMVVPLPCKLARV